MSERELDDLDTELDLDDEEDEESETQETEGADVSEDDKRVRDLQSKADKETARANKLQQQLDALKKGEKNTDKTVTSGLPAEAEQWVTAARIGVRTQLYESDPRLKEYGFSPELITGSTPAEMQASFQSLRKMISKVESVAQKKAAQEYGGAPDLMGGGPAVTSTAEWQKMSSEEFNKFIDSI